MGQNLLSKDFPDIDGFQDTVIGKVLRFNVIGKQRKYIQILHCGSNHWICVANMTSEKVDNDTHFIYYSLASRNISADVLSQIARYSKHEEPQLEIHVTDVQHQGSGDCGVFAVAFATSLAFGQNPEKISYDKKLMLGLNTKVFTER